MSLYSIIFWIHSILSFLQHYINFINRTFKQLALIRVDGCDNKKNKKIMPSKCTAWASKRLNTICALYKWICVTSIYNYQSSCENYLAKSSHRIINSCLYFLSQSFAAVSIVLPYNPHIPLDSPKLKLEKMSQNNGWSTDSVWPK